MGFDGRDRAVGAFKRAGWVCAMPQDHGMRQRAYEDALRRGDAEWTCPECVRLRSRSARRRACPESGKLRKRLAFGLTSSYDPVPMEPRRTPFRVNLDRLTQNFARAVLDAVRRANIAEILGMPSADPRPGNRATSPAAPSREAKEPARARKPQKARAARGPAPAPLPTVLDEPEMAEGTEIDAQALLASIDAELPPRAWENQGSLTPLLEPPAPPPPAPPPEPTRRSTPALRDGEQALRTGSGQVVLRRRRAAESAA